MWQGEGGEKRQKRLFFHGMTERNLDALCLSELEDFLFCLRKKEIGEKKEHCSLRYLLKPRKEASGQLVSVASSWQAGLVSLSLFLQIELLVFLHSAGIESSIQT